MNYFYYFLCIFVFKVNVEVNANANCACGVENINTRVVGGDRVPEHRYPWMVKIKLETDDESMNCVGALISDRYILTAAHCFADNPTKVSVRLGSNYDYVGGVVFNIKRVYIHNRFNVTYLYNDIALIRLPQRIQFSKTIRPICIPLKPLNQPEFYTVAGWGYIDANTEESSPYLQETVVKPFSFEKCNKYWEVLTHKQMCAGNIGKDTCTGDSGGPLMQKFRGKFYTVGIVSFGDGSCGTKPHSVYTKLNEYIGWIAHNTRDSTFCRY